MMLINGRVPPSPIPRPSTSRSPSHVASWSATVDRRCLHPSPDKRPDPLDRFSDRTGPGTPRSRPSQPMMRRPTDSVQQDCQVRGCEAHGDQRDTLRLRRRKKCVVRHIARHRARRTAARSRVPRSSGPETGDDVDLPIENHCRLTFGETRATPRNLTLMFIEDPNRLKRTDACPARPPNMHVRPRFGRRRYDEGVENGATQQTANEVGARRPTGLPCDSSTFPQFGYLNRPYRLERLRRYGAARRRTDVRGQHDAQGPRCPTCAEHDAIAVDRAGRPHRIRSR